MAEFLRPSANITQTSYTGGFQEIDETDASDSDFAYGAINSSTPTLEVATSDPSNTPNGQTSTVRWRSAKRNGAGTIGSGNAITGTCTLLQGANTIASDSYSLGSWSTRSFTFNNSSVSNWTDLRLRFTQTASGGNNSTQRCGLAVSWAEIEAAGRRRIVRIS